MESRIKAERKICNDKHEYLIAMWQALQCGYILPDSVSEEQYRYIREHKDEDKALTGFVGFACPDNKLSTILHECIHWKDAAEYRLEFGEITAQNYQTEYLPYLRKRCKLSLDRLAKKGYNIYEISPYATDRFLVGAYDETYTEYRVIKYLGGE